MPHSSTSELLALHAVRLKGFVDSLGAARRYGLDPRVVDEHLLDAHARGWVTRSGFAGTHGWSLTDAGRAANEAHLARELDETGARPEVEAAHASSSRSTPCSPTRRPAGSCVPRGTTRSRRTRTTTGTGTRRAHGPGHVSGGLRASSRGSARGWSASAATTTASPPPSCAPTPTLRGSPASRSTRATGCGSSCTRTSSPRSASPAEPAGSSGPARSPVLWRARRGARHHGVVTDPTVLPVRGEVARRRPRRGPRAAGLVAPRARRRRAVALAGNACVGTVQVEAAEVPHLVDVLVRGLRPARPAGPAPRRGLRRGAAVAPASTGATQAACPRCHPVRPTTPLPPKRVRGPHRAPHPCSLAWSACASSSPVPAAASAQPSSAGSSRTVPTSTRWTSTSRPSTRSARP